VNASIRIETRLKTVLLAISLEVENELLALVGRPGSGKTMILRAIAGVFTPDTAAVEIDGETLFSSGLSINVPPSARRIGYVPQSHALYPHLNVFDNVAVALSKQQIPDDLDIPRRVSEVLDLLALWRVRGLFPDRLDPMALQRAALARAIVGDPALLLMDDPFSSLPDDVRREARSEFMSLRRQLGVPTIFATGDLEEAYELADRIALLEGGSILQTDTPRDLLTRPSSRLVADIVRSVNVLPGVVFYLDSEDDHGLLVRTSLGVLRVDEERPFTDDVDVTVRPEQIVLIDADDRRENAVGGTITSTTRHGSYYGVVVTPHEPPGAEPLHLFVSEHVYLERGLAEGIDCVVALPPTAIHLMPRGQDPGAASTA
jgi:ABC-type sulfate/molybdate transport systems ATPase subunit